MNSFSQITRFILGFGERHSMIEDSIYFHSAEDLSDHIWGSSTFFALPLDADISRAEGSPVYVLRYEVGVIQKFSTVDLDTKLDAQASALFCLGQLVDAIIQEAPEDTIADIQGARFDGESSTESAEGTVAWISGTLEVTVPRKPYSQEIAYD
jgi:hypothetical protein